VLIQRGAGAKIGLSDESYREAGASLINSAAEVFQKAEMIVKVKEPQAQECAMLREDQILFTYLHLAPDPQQTNALLQSGATCIAYETVTAMNGALP
jgi:alanine dehydrogenase